MHLEEDIRDLVITRMTLKSNAPDQYQGKLFLTLITRCNFEFLAHIVKTGVP